GRGQVVVGGEDRQQRLRAIEHHERGEPGGEQREVDAPESGAATAMRLIGRGHDLEASSGSVMRPIHGTGCFDPLMNSPVTTLTITVATSESRNDHAVPSSSKVIATVRKNTANSKHRVMKGALRTFSVLKAPFRT